MPDDAAQLAVGYLARPIKPVSPDDPAGKAVLRLRQSPVGAVPIAQGFQLVGVLTEADLAPLLSQGAESWRKLRVSDLAQREAVAVPSDMPLAGALHAFEESGQPVLLVADGPNSCRGLITRSDVLAAASGELVPPHIGGMATPLGVHLTTGTVRAGASDLGLFLTGAMLMSFNYVAGAILALVALVVQFFAGPASPIYAFIAGIGLVPNAERWPAYADYTLLVAGVQFVLFLELMRISPLSGYHAAEHQTVNAIEAGEPVDEVQVFVDDYGLTFPVWPDPTLQATAAFRNPGLPSSYVIDRQGNVRLAWAGAINRQMLEKHVTPLLEE